MGKRFGIMLIGCGHIGEEHIADIYYRDAVSIEAVVDTDPERAQLFCRKYGAKQSGTDYRAFLPDPAIDIVIIATYANTHVSILEDCLRFGKHVLCEKPLADTPEHGRRFYELVKAAPTKVLVAHVLRHNRTYQTVASLLHNGVIGELRLMRMVQNHHAMDWDRYKRLMQDCPPYVDCGVHYLDVMQWFSQSPIVEVSGIGGILDADMRTDNFGIIHARMQNGCIASYEAGWSRNLVSRNIKEFIGTKGHIRLILQADRTDHAEEGDEISLYSSETGEYRTINVQAKYKDMYAQLSALMQMIAHDAPANPTIDEVFRAFRVSLAAEQAMQTHTAVAIPPEEPETSCAVASVLPWPATLSSPRIREH